MALVQEMAAVVEAESWPTWIVVEHEVSVFIGLGQRCAIAELTEEGDRSARIFERVDPGRDLVECEVALNYGRSVPTF